MMRRKEKILVAMSGGVDSSVAAALLVDQGYDVTGAYMVNYDDKPMDENMASCWAGDYRDALRVAAKLGISLLRLDFTKEYERDVLQYMYAEYKRGNTPNPDVLCNKFLKFGAWLKKACELGFDYMATGHYARKGERDDMFHLLMAVDENKDQTYFLHQLTQDQLRHALFPVGEYSKEQVRKLALKFDLPTAQKEESMGICFVGEVPMKEFLMKKITPKKGNVVLSDGTVIGQHDGLPFYTIGQRHGLSFREAQRQGISDDQKLGQRSLTSVRDDNTKPLFVVDKQEKTNELVVGYENDPLLYRREIAVSEVSWINGQARALPLQCTVRTRHRQPLQMCTIKHGDRGVVVQFVEPQRAITPGQFAVFYKNGECLGGGTIQ